MKKFSNRISNKIDEIFIQEKSLSLSSLNLINKEEELKIIKQLISFIDLTTLEGTDTKEKVKELCKKAKNPLSYFQGFDSPQSNINDSSNKKPITDIPSFSKNNNNFLHCAAVCVYPCFINIVKKSLKGSNVKTASVTTAFPSGQYPMELKLKDVKYCVKSGADEIDMVISRGRFLSGNFNYVYNEVNKVKKICTSDLSVGKSNKKRKKVTLKVILETGELGMLENIRKASFIAMSAGADFIKTSTGKIQPAATLPATLVMAEAIREFYNETGIKKGLKPAGGIKTTKQAIEYYMLIKNVLGDEWLIPELFRIGASSLLDNLVQELVVRGSMSA
ncbi:MAG: deoxyribose-phosphate aldolase [Ignavibacteria bacterium]|nr:deoxyribose-phosphate aldolase [Ignavibacteria bacterium]